MNNTISTGNQESPFRIDTIGVLSKKRPLGTSVPLRIIMSIAASGRGMQ